MAAAGLFESDDNEDVDEKIKYKRQDIGRGNGDRAGKPSNFGINGDTLKLDCLNLCTCTYTCNVGWWLIYHT